MVLILTKKLRLTIPGVMQHWCSGCNGRHNINYEQRNSSGAVWQYNEDINAPTFSPSIHIHYQAFNGTEEEELEYERRRDNGEAIIKPTIQKTLCHYFITLGKIQYLSDCVHEYKGITMDLPDFPDWVNN